MEEIYGENADLITGVKLNNSIYNEDIRASPGRKANLVRSKAKNLKASKGKVNQCSKNITKKNNEDEESSEVYMNISRTCLEIFSMLEEEIHSDACFQSRLEFRDLFRSKIEDFNKYPLDFLEEILPRSIDSPAKLVESVIDSIGNLKIPAFTDNPFKEFFTEQCKYSNPVPMAQVYQTLQNRLEKAQEHIARLGTLLKQFQSYQSKLRSQNDRYRKQMEQSNILEYK
uniref:Uncharacterized protein n=1 Tax=Euplotes crassus TaxID=5936 RepID=A0A7S3KL58_EUPCR|mmetsp:Transcript_30257/g.29753  ORF Transcript_30257/g.29753 Transcript_30257/m.29753 type:complete len:228 (+) Transcript_30257:325-1008(+)